MNEFRLNSLIAGTSCLIAVFNLNNYGILPVSITNFLNCNFQEIYGPHEVLNERFAGKTGLLVSKFVRMRQDV